MEGSSESSWLTRALYHGGGQAELSAEGWARLTRAGKIEEMPVWWTLGVLTKLKDLGRYPYRFGLFAILWMPNVCWYEQGWGNPSCRAPELRLSARQCGR